MGEYKRFARWQTIRINQLSFINNLILGLSIGLIVYIINFIVSNEKDLTFYQKLFFWIGSLLTIISIFSGILLAIIRLENYRITAKKALQNDKNEEKGITLSNNDLTSPSKFLDKITWIFFYFQIFTFIISFLAFALLLFIEIQNKIT